MNLTGRSDVIELFPFSLREARRAKKALSVEAYLQGGGFPEPFSSSDGERLLRRYFDDIVERDVREHVGARSTRPLRQLVQMVFESAGSELSLRRLSGATGIAVETAGAYLEAAEAAYLLFGCKFFAHSAKKRTSRNRKFYPVDPGLRRVSVTRTGDDRGKSLECATFVALRREDREIYYWRGRGEVDFVIRRQGRIVPVQVTWEGLTERHERALEEFYGEFPDAAQPLVVTADSLEDML